MEETNFLSLPEHDIKHLAIIMDGNARWAKIRGLSTLEGHKKGAEKIKELVPIIAKETNLAYLTLYAFSSENWQRSKKEINLLISLFENYLKTELNNLMKNNIKLKIIGRLYLLTPELQSLIKETIEKTENNNGMTLCIAFSYSSKNEMIDACQKAIDDGIKNITEEILYNYFYDPKMPAVDLLIRTGGEMRISNCLLWQSAYAELIFISKYWPDFDRQEIINVINEYNKRTRTFGQRHK